MWASIRAPPVWESQAVEGSGRHPKVACGWNVAVVGAENMRHLGRCLRDAVGSVTRAVPEGRAGAGWRAMIFGLWA
jgi:hypothetical protein